jgi:hypothetical protein
MPKKRHHWVVEKIYISSTMGITQADSLAPAGKLCFDFDQLSRRFGGPIDE